MKRVRGETKVIVAGMNSWSGGRRRFCGGELKWCRLVGRAAGCTGGTVENGTFPTRMRGRKMLISVSYSIAFLKGNNIAC